MYIYIYILGIYIYIYIYISVQDQQRQHCQHCQHCQHILNEEEDTYMRRRIHTALSAHLEFPDGAPGLLVLKCSTKC